MKVGLIGLGQAGGKLAEKFLEYEQEMNADLIQGVKAINSAKADLQGLQLIPEEHKVLIGQSEVKGHGVGADNELGSKIARDDLNEIMNSVSSFPVHKIDAFVVMAALGGGTGSGGSPVVSQKLREVYTEPVYSVGVLPGNEGGLADLNSARSFRTLVDKTDGLILFDNDSWRSAGETSQGGYDNMNKELIKRFGLLCQAGEIAHDNSAVGETVVDASEIINTLGSAHNPSNGITSIGYSEAELPDDILNKGGGLLSRFTSSSPTDDMEESVQSTNRITSQVRQAVNGKLTVPVDIDSTDRALVVVAGPPEAINRKGVEEARQWVEEETGCREVRGGDYPIPNSSTLQVVVCLSGVSQSDRIKEIQEVGAEAEAKKKELESQGDIDDLLRDMDPEDENANLDSLF